MEDKFFESEVYRRERFMAIKKEFLIVMIMLIVGMMTVFLWYKTVGPRVMKVFVDMENTYEINGKIYLSSYGFFPQNDLQKVSVAFSGTSSLKILPTQKYSLNFEHKGLMGGESVSISAWRKTEKPGRAIPEFVITAGDFWQSVKKAERVNPEGWKRSD